ncbi:phosphoenolpyruvate--protein phosphotransferase [Telmatospirillum sp.]|uniref:phosphoenolpyruvate--protein phosphotransferase n=1 Tax=Telmatospirillum sp. TaxID=2079197 RepID=UPI00284B66FC|nr:phosphoenolpyruvate--protein phosphotransferase [Telmatospirillum sp.]MDR3440027.1 phosphoenolpyruvate--protein phosphotransferase [Telmatospirillum sp.]
MHGFRGVGASPGIAIGRVFVHVPPSLAVSDATVPAALRQAEVESFLQGRQKALVGFESLIDKVRAEKGDDLAGVFEGHAEILMDEELGEAIVGRIRDDGQSALAAVRDAMEAQRAEFLALDDEYLRQRADDLSDIGRRLMLAIAGVEEVRLEDLPKGSIVVAQDLGPSDTARLDRDRVAGFVVAAGGRTSHVAIMARTLELPAVVGCADIFDVATSGQVIALDGGDGRVMVDPDAEALADFECRRAAHATAMEAMRALSPLPATTGDGHRAFLGVNIGTPADAEAALPWNPDGVGLYRTEFLFMNRTGLPSEEEQYRAYAAVVRAMKGRPVVIRTLDVGGDKPVDGLGFTREDNPFLGWRGARLFLYGSDGAIPNRDPEVKQQMEAQLSAVLRAAVDGNVWLMYPMISSVEEVDVLRQQQDDVRARLAAAGRQVGQIRTGIMIETPGAALVADKLAEKVDFFSIGSNDLTQYTLAADRGNGRIAPVYQPFHPGVWRLIAGVIKAARRRAIPVGLCGELAGIEEAALPLLGLGLDEYSMAAPTLPRIKRIIRAATMPEAEAIARAILDAPTAAAALAMAGDAMRAVLGRVQ